MRYLMETLPPLGDSPTIYFQPHHIQVFHPDGDVQVLGNIMEATLYADQYTERFIKLGEEHYPREKHITTDPNTILTVEIKWLTGDTHSFNVNRAIVADAGTPSYELNITTERHEQTHRYGLYG